jgi:hypothetical protein
MCVCMYVYIYIYTQENNSLNQPTDLGCPEIRRFSSFRQIRHELEHKCQFLDTQVQNQQITLNGEIPNKTSAMHFFQDALTVKIQVFWGRYAELTSKQ